MKSQIELEEPAVPHKDGAYRKEIEKLLEYNLIEPSTSPWGMLSFSTTLDQGSQFVQVPLGKQDRKKMGSTRKLGIFQFKRMSSACATRDSHIAETDVTRTNKGDEKVCELGHVLGGQCGKSNANCRRSHRERRRIVACMKRASLKCKQSKCKTLKGSVKYLMRMVD